MSKVEDEPPAKFNVGSLVRNSLSSSGCIINGEVHNSMLFRKVFIGRNSIVKNSIILNGTYIGDNCYIENCIVDSKCNIPNGSVHKAEVGEIEIIVNREPFYL
jgi:glucose-1-phosphate adenylyltransferase